LKLESFLDWYVEKQEKNVPLRVLLFLPVVFVAVILVLQLGAPDR
jgi:hypothetical protein